MISRRARSGGGGLQRLLSAACLLISLPRGLAWPRKLISGACNTSHPLCWPEQRPTLAATCSPNTNTQAPLWPWPCPAAPTQCTHFGTVHYWKPTVSCAWAKRHTCAHLGEHNEPLFFSLRTRRSMFALTREGKRRVCGIYVGGGFLTCGHACVGAKTPGRS